jgi:hypothetical protein
VRSCEENLPGWGGRLTAPRRGPRRRCCDQPDIGDLSDPAGHGGDCAGAGAGLADGNVADHLDSSGVRILQRVDSDVDQDGAGPDVLGADEPGHTGGDDEDVGLTGVPA